MATAAQDESIVDDAKRSRIEKRKLEYLQSKLRVSENKEEYEKARLARRSLSSGASRMDKLKADIAVSKAKSDWLQARSRVPKLRKKRSDSD